MADAASPALTLGVEEEFQLVDPGTGQLRGAGHRVLDRARRAVGDAATTELFDAQVEVGTPVCRTLADVRRELVRLRRTLLDAAAREGLRLVASGTHPFSRWEDQQITAKDRYRAILDEFQQLTREQIICGCHVHVGIADPDEAVRVMNRVRPWLPTVLALSANSPFWLGTDTGYASYRTSLFGRFPMTGLPEWFADRAHYDRVVADLVATGIIDEPSKIYWDVRPSSHFATLEFRIADVATTVDAAVLIAGLARGLATSCLGRTDLDDEAKALRPELLRAAKWQAARFGLAGDLIDVRQVRAIPARAAVDALLDFARPGLEASGDRDEVARLVDDLFARGTGADRQRAEHEASGDLAEVVDRLARDTAAGLD